MVAGRRTDCVRCRNRRKHRVYVIGPDGGHLRRMTSESSIDGVASWSAEGRWIYFSSTRAGAIPDIWRVSPGGGPATRMTRNGGFEPKESPDGRYLFYLDRAPPTVATDGTAKLMRASLAGGQEELVLGRVRAFLWSVTDKGLCSSPASGTSMRLISTASAISVLPEWAGSPFGYKPRHQPDSRRVRR
jgi:hypothetical protein